MFTLPLRPGSGLKTKAAAAIALFEFLLNLPSNYPFRTKCVEEFL